MHPLPRKVLLPQPIRAGTTTSDRQGLMIQIV
jgi:hypothetical protein